MSQINFPKIYNPANQPKEELIKNFVVRTNIFQEIFDDIKTSKMEHPEQHYIIQGIRGQGKTTLLLRIAYEIENDTKLNKWLIPVVFSEELYKVRKLFKLWEVIAEFLEKANLFPHIFGDMRNIEYDEDYENQCFQLLESTLQRNQKKLILFIDNIDDIFRKFTGKEQHRLREILMETSEIRIIGASAKSLEFHQDYGKPFYEFFRMPILKGLNRKETNNLLLNLGEEYKRERVKDIVQNQSGRVEALRRMTGGVIRTIVILFQIFVDDENGNAFQDLEKILDEVTPLYKHRMDNLSAQQQEIVDIIALNWDAISTKEIALKAREQSKAVSSQLKILIRNQLVEQQSTTTKNYLYRLSERFFNIWYLMRHGGKNEENKVRWLVEFLQIWCDDKELERKANSHLECISNGNIYDKFAYYMTEALAQASLKRDLQDKLVKETRKYLESKKSDFLEYLHPSDIELQESAIVHIFRQETNKFIKNLEKIRNKDVEQLILLGLYSTYFNEIEKAEKYLLEATKQKDVKAMYFLAKLYQTKFKKFKKAEKFYLYAVKRGHIEAMFSLALLYETKFRDFTKAKKYYLLAVEKENFKAMHNLALLYQIKFNDFRKAVKYSKMGFKIQKNCVYPIILLWNNKIEQSIKYFQEFMNDEFNIDNEKQRINNYLQQLIAKKQYHSVLKIFNKNQYQLKDRFKPIYYALMYFMQEEYPNEYIKMGSELKQTVEEIIANINEMAEEN
ncbi:MAG: hypothetical protein K8S23_09840 [Candidatus Cloacimonetes bacterium]|nr:hypothetical protein [Candidatus Cloacimonadota bacterium]